LTLGYAITPVNFLPLIAVINRIVNEANFLNCNLGHWFTGNLPVIG
jgi:hypothetical protein